MSSSYSYKTLLTSIKMLDDLYESTLTLHFIEVASAEYRFQGGILYIFSNRLFKAVRLGEPTETRNRPFMKGRFANKGIDALNLRNMLNQKSVQSTIPPYFQYKDSTCIFIPVQLLPKCSITKQVFSKWTSMVFPRTPHLVPAVILNFYTLHVAT